MIMKRIVIKSKYLQEATPKMSYTVTESIHVWQDNFTIFIQS